MSNDAPDSLQSPSPRKTRSVGGFYKIYPSPGRQPNEAPPNPQLKYKLPSVAHYLSWIERENRTTPFHKQAFTRTERLISFCKVACNWGRRRIHRELGISERQTSNFFKKLKDWQS